MFLLAGAFIELRGEGLDDELDFLDAVLLPPQTEVFLLSFQLRKRFLQVDPDLPHLVARHFLVVLVGDRIQKDFFLSEVYFFAGLPRIDVVRKSRSVAFHHLPLVGRNDLLLAPDVYALLPLVIQRTEPSRTRFRRFGLGLL